MRKIYTVSILTVISCLYTNVYAQDGAEGWDGSIEFSAANATGNAENTTLGLAFSGGRKIGNLTHNLAAAVNYAEATLTDSSGNQVTDKTQDNWFISYQLDKQISDRTYAYGRARYEQDQFSGFDDRTFLGAGLGHHIFQSERKNWKIDGGPGYQIATITPPPAPIPANFEDRQEEFALYAASDFSYLIRDGVDFSHNLNTTWTEANTTFNTTVALTTQLTSALSSKLSYQVDHETDPPAGRKDTDTLLKASLLFGF
ncbi:MAG: DUF481 domain-containing protein [bacterium]